MDDRRFDAITKRLASTGSRRAALRLTGGGALAALLGRLGLEGAAAACVAAGKNCDKGEKCCAGAACKGGKCKCKEGLKDCGKTCRQCCGPADCPSGVCTEGRCGDASCSDNVKNGTETDTDCGGSCAKCADGKGCAGNGDCGTGFCSGGTCRTPTCTDNARNGNETDVDCGGGCPKCANGGLCRVDSDCASNICRTATPFAFRTCRAADCGDGVKNGNETDVDCGGACARCRNGQTCTGGNDCVSGACGRNRDGGFGSSSFCRPAHCFNGRLDGDESDGDCGGSCGVCPSTLRCRSNADCGSGGCNPDTGTCRGGAGCFVAGTRVAMADGASRLIELVGAGDRVIGRDGRVNTVLGVARPVLGERELYALNGGPAFVTAGHPFLTVDGWKAVDPDAARAAVPGLSVGRLVVGDRILALAGVLAPAMAGGVGFGGEAAVEVRLEPTALRSLEGRWAEPATPLFNLHVDGDHSYLANELVVHNKSAETTLFPEEERGA